MSAGLLLIDIQNDYFSGGLMELVGMKEAAARASSLLSAFREEGLPVIHVQHLSTNPNAGFFIPGTIGAEIHPLVMPYPEEIVIEKHFPNSFHNTKLGEELAWTGVENLVICGAMTHMCVDATTRAARDLGYDCTVIADACATCDLEFRGTHVPANMVQAAFLAAMEVYGEVSDTSTILYRLSGI
ncbi:isochorismatase [Methanomicrobiaceae archaeon CYW5]|uniref:cysteine hydrolase family protein n=1 Tax=Methanovulcanius yangii TaxID=1789227 RepID=UPI0029C9B404|nr:cysteine hydrolase family protein [Methanovulcanius yangii]MBT8507053.1 isochorismatase [Methanovulcanius yangii]